MEETQNIEPEIQPTVQAPVKKTRYGLWLGIIFAVMASINLFGLPYIYHSQIPAGLQGWVYTIITPISHILCLTTDLDGNSWIKTVAFLGAFIVPKVPYISTIIFLLLPASIYFLIGAIIGSIIGKLRSNATLLGVFLLIISLFVGYRLYNYRQIYYPRTVNDCFANADEFTQGLCISQLAREKKDVEMCKKIPQGNHYQSECYSMVTIEVREYGVCDKMPFGEEYSYPHKTACRDNIASMRSECEQISTQEGQDECYIRTSQSIQQYAKQNACERFKEVLGLKHLIQKCEDFKSGKITTVDTCEKIKDENLKNQCVKSPVIGTIMFGPEKPEPVEGLYGPGTPETEEEIRNRPKPKEEDMVVVSEAPIEQNNPDIVAEIPPQEISKNTTCHDTDGGIQPARKGNLYVDNNGGILTDLCQRKTGEDSYESTESCGGESCFLEETNCESESKSYRTFPADYIACPEGCQDGICREPKENKKQIVVCNNLFQEQDRNYDFWKNKFEALFPKLYLNMIGAFCVMNDGGHLISIAYSSITGEDKQMIIKFDKYGEMVANTELIDCRFDSPNYFRFQDEVGENVNIICENNFWRGVNGGVGKKIVSKTTYALNMETLQVKVIRQE